MSCEILTAVSSQADELWDELTRAEQEKFAHKMLPEAERRRVTSRAHARAIFSELIIVAGHAQATADRFLTLRCFIAQTSANQHAWAQLHTIIGVGRCYLEFTVHDRDRFLAALKEDGYAVNSWMERVGRLFCKYHRFDNARARTVSRFDPQLHFCNDRADEEYYGPNYFSTPWDAQSVYARHSSLVSRIPAALSHARHPATPEQVREYLRRKNLRPNAECGMRNEPDGFPHFAGAILIAETGAMNTMCCS